MELFLNLVCVLIAALTLVWWHRRARATRAGRRGWRRDLIELVTIACALAIFLPSISVTDDLHAQLAVVEDSSSRRKDPSASSGKALVGHHTMATPPAMLPGLALPCTFSLSFFRLSAVESDYFGSAFLRNVSPRGPPRL